jgi:hypothetical protein
MIFIGMQVLGRHCCRLLALEEERRQLQAHLESAVPSPVPSTSNAELRAAREEAKHAHRTVERLQAELAAERSRAGEAVAACAAKVGSLERAVAAGEEARQALEKQLQLRPTQQQLEALRREVQALQAVRFGSLDGAADEDSGNGASVVDKALLARVRELEHLVTVRLRSPPKSGHPCKLAASRALQRLHPPAYRRLKYNCTAKAVPVSFWISTCACRR